ncbi:MAG: GAF domain-containing protein [Chloroflexota bacterium]
MGTKIVQQQQGHPPIYLNILQAQSLPEIAQLTLNYLHRLLACRQLAVIFFDFNQQQALTYFSDDGAKTQPQEIYFPLQAIGIAPPLLNGKYHIVHSLRRVTHLATIEQYLIKKGVDSYVSLPVISQGDLAGAIILGTAVSTQLQATMIPLAAETAVQVAMAVQQLRLRQATERHLQELTILHTIARIGSETTDEQQLIHEALTVIHEKMNADYVGILLLDPAKQQLYTPNPPKTAIPLQGTSLEAQVVRQGKSDHILDLQEDRTYSSIIVGMRSKLVAPLKVNGRILGVVVAEDQSPHKFGEADSWFVSSFARQLATAIDRIRVAAMEHQQTRQMIALNKLGQTITASLDLREVLQRIVDIVPPLINATGGAVLLLENDDLIYTAVSGLYMQPLLGTVADKHATDIKTILQTGKAILHHASTPAVDPLSCIALPLKMGQETIGILQTTHEHPNAFTQEDLIVLEGTAPWVSIAIENARLHHQVQHHAVELEERVKKRTLELQETNSELSQYAYAVSHDLRTPLRGIRNYTDFLQEDLADTIEGEQKRYLEGLLRAVREADHMVDGLLTLSRISSRDLPLESLDMGIFLRGLLTSLELPPTITVQIDSNWPTIKTEVALLRQIFQNLILNGIKFNRSASKQIYLGWQTIDRSTYQFNVQDNGIGIDPTYQDRIFGVFERLHTYQEYAGTGIGLAIVRKAVRKLGGTIHVESALGKGSTFIVRLPRN